jgi:hypothetical protein
MSTHLSTSNANFHGASIGKGKGKGKGGKGKGKGGKGGKGARFQPYGKGGKGGSTWTAQILCACCNAAGHQSSFCAGWYGPFSGNVSAALDAKRRFHSTVEYGVAIECIGDGRISSRHESSNVIMVDSNGQRTAAPGIGAASFTAFPVGARPLDATFSEAVYNPKCPVNLICVSNILKNKDKSLKDNDVSFKLLKFDLNVSNPTTHRTIPIEELNGLFVIKMAFIAALTAPSSNSE